MASPTVDGTAFNNTWHAASAATVTLSTTQTNDVILVAVGLENVPALYTVSSVTSASGLSFTRRSQEISAANHVVVETWQASSPSILTGEVITVNVTGSGAAMDAGVIFACGIHGVGTLATPNDGDASLPSLATAAAAPPAATYSTSQADDLLIGLYCANSSVSTTPAPSGWTQVLGKINTSGSFRNCTLALYDKSVSATQSGQTFTAPSSGTNNVVVVDAFTADITAVNVNVTGVTGVGHGNTVVPSIASTAAKASAAGAAHAVGTAGSGGVTPASAIGHGQAHAVGLMISSTVHVTGVAAAGHAHAAGSASEVSVDAGPVSAVGIAGAVEGFTPPVVYLPTQRLMRNTRVPSQGAMSNAVVASVGRLEADGPEPSSIAVDVAGVSAQGRAAAIMPSRRRNTGISGVAGLGVAGRVGFAVL